MGVNGGAGNAISLSELQSYYGGSNPISLSEYYRNGSLVPGDQVTAQSNVSGTADQTVGQFTVDVTTTNAFTGSLSSGTTINPFNGNASYTIAADTAYVIYGHAHPDADGGNSNVSGTITIGGSSSNYTTEDNTGNGAFVAGGTVRGPAHGGAGSGTILSAGTGITAYQSGNLSRLIRYTRANVTTHDVDFRNNNAVTITTTSGSTGGAQTYTQNQTRKVKNDQSTSNWTLGYNAVNGNTNVPSSGTINMNVFNAPGNPTP